MCGVCGSDHDKDICDKCMSLATVHHLTPNYFDRLEKEHKILLEFVRDLADQDDPRAREVLASLWKK